MKHFDKEKMYPVEEALKLVKDLGKKKFDETVELHYRLGINPKKGDQQVRSTVVLPHTFGKAKKVAAFVPEDKKSDAKEAGADVVYTEPEIAELIKTGKMDFDIAVGVPEIMKNLAPLARILGPKGLMPSPKNDTITTNLAKTIGELKKGKMAFKNDDSANLHIAIGKTANNEKELLENFNAVNEAVEKAKPEAMKGIYVKNLTVCSTMGPGIKVQI